MPDNKDQSNVTKVTIIIAVMALLCCGEFIRIELKLNELQENRMVHHVDNDIITSRNSGGIQKVHSVAKNDENTVLKNTKLDQQRNRKIRVKRDIVQRSFGGKQSRHP